MGLQRRAPCSGAFSTGLDDYPFVAWVAVLCGVALWFTSASSRAQTEAPLPPIPVEFRADEVHVDARAGALEVLGHVHVDEPPFFFTSEGLRLQRVPIGVVLDGVGKVAFCPCLGTPLAVRFQGATIAPPHDVVLKGPVLELFGVPIAWAPFFWLRSPGRPGLLPPEVAWRGADGLFLGAGAHLPLVPGDMERGVDLRAGGYVDGGVAVDIAARTTQSVTRVRWDWLRSGAPTTRRSVASLGGAGGATLDAWGSTAMGQDSRPDTVAWSVDAVRGARALVATVDVDEAARAFDRAEARMTWRLDGWALSSGIRSVAVRGGDWLDVGAAGPIVTASRGSAIRDWGAYDAVLEAGALSGNAGNLATFARAQGGGLLAGRLGLLGGSLALRGVADVADDGTAATTGAALQARASVALPLERAFGQKDDPWTHRTEPRVEAGAFATQPNSVLPVAAALGGQAAGGAWLAIVGWDNTLGRWSARDSLDLEAGAGAVGRGRSICAALRGRASARGVWLWLQSEVARVHGPSCVQGSSGTGGAFVARARIGSEQGLHLAAHVAARDGVDPVLARALVDGPSEPSGGFLSAQGWTAGARLAIPLGDRVTARGGADVDFTAREWVAAVAAIELHDPCNCVVVRASMAHRIGRDGVDAWLTVNLPR